MKELFVASREYPGASEYDMTVFTSKTKAIKKFNEYWELVAENECEGSYIEIKKDKEVEKEYFHSDGTYGYTVQLKKITIGEEFSAF